MRKKDRYAYLVLHYYTRKLFYHFKQAQKPISNLSNLLKKGKCLPLTKTIREYYINITFPDWVIVENIIPRNVIITFSEMIFFDYHQIRECNIYFIIPNIRSFIFYRLRPTVVRGVPKGK